MPTDGALQTESKGAITKLRIDAIKSFWWLGVVKYYVVVRSYNFRIQRRIAVLCVTSIVCFVSIIACADEALLSVKFPET
ncbi:hypothetical protein evm_009339 [Chilo suppressalis]|nr:hypothetical protein evm_009339 [Chilo suppressalis]